MWAALIAVTLGLSGCNQAFGIEGTVFTPIDADEDGVEDELDNCPTAANPGQDNQDGDAFGDACDTCPTLSSDSTHDEDGDRRGDDCDVCPGSLSFHDDDDGDGVGDACERDSVPSRRVGFDPFVINTGWASRTTPWQATGDSIAPLALLDADDPGLHNDKLVLDSVPWHVDAGYVALAPWGAGDQIGVVFESADRVAQARCSLLAISATSYQFRIVTPETETAIAVAAVAPASLKLTAYASPISLNCSLAGFASGNASLVGLPPVTISLLASPNLQVTYVDIID